MVDINVLINKVNYIESNLQKLQVLMQLTEEEFIDKFYYCGSAKYYLQTCIEAMIDITHHIIARERFRAPENYADAFVVLEENGIISNEYVQKFKQMCKFRNRIVHLYHDINDKEIYKILMNDLGDIDLFVKSAIKKYI